MNWSFTSGLPETFCGYGSTLKATEHLRSNLLYTLNHIGLKKVLDAPCGDFNWMGLTGIAPDDYVGIDADPAHIEACTARAPEFTFILGDIIYADLPNAEIMICRDFHQHLPLQVALQAIDNFKRSGISWLAATTNYAGQNNEVDMGGFYPVDLQKFPFAFPAPRYRIEDPVGTNRYLGFWKASDL